MREVPAEEMRKVSRGTASWLRSQRPDALYLGFREHDAFFSRLFLQSDQPLFEGLQVVALPNGAHPGRRNKNADFAQFVARPHLAVRRAGHGKFDNRLLRGFFHAILRIGLAPADFKQRFDASGVSRCLIPVKGVPRKAHDAAGFGDVAEFGGKVQKSGLVFDHVLIETFHGKSPWARCPVDGSFALPSKRRFPFLSRATCQIKS